MHNEITKAESAEDMSMEISTEAFDTLRKVLKVLKGFNLDCYKDKCIKRRISIRIRATHCKTADEYCDLLLENESELDLLLKVLTIHVSHFFRNPTTFEKLERDILPGLLERCIKEQHQDLKIWSAGCATGEEPYSLAIVLKEAFPAQIDNLTVSITGTDVDAGTLHAARAGVYAEDRLEEVMQSIRSRYFEQKGPKYHLSPEIKEMVQFHQRDIHDLDTYEKSDLILCRNVLIYFERLQQQKIIEGFASALNRGGFLVLGKSETLFGPCREYFRTVCPMDRIYQAI